MQPRIVEDGQEPVGGWYLYRFFTRVPCAVRCCQLRHPLYIGKSNDPLRRWLEHAPKQPWWSAQCGYEIDERVWPSDRAVRDAETAAIHAELPLANIDGNEHNPHRLDFGQRVPRPARSQAGRVAQRPVAVPPRHEARAWLYSRPTGYLALWLVVAVGLWCVTGHGGWDGALAGALGSSGSFAVAWIRTPRRKRRPRRR